MKLILILAAIAIVSCVGLKKEHPIAVTGSRVPLSTTYEDAIFKEDKNVD